MSKKAITPPPTADVTEPPFEPLLTVADLSRLLARCPSTILSWARSGRLPRPLPITGCKMLWRATTIKRWLASLEGDAAGR
jgi:hypothetical protein